MGDDMGYPILQLPHRVLQIFWDIQLTLGYSGYWKIIKSQIRNLNKGYRLSNFEAKLSSALG